MLPIRVPSLSERTEDLAELANHFCSLASSRHRLPRFALSPAAIRAVLTAAWPGNVRQLEHAVEAAAIRAASEGAERIEPRHLFPDRERTIEDKEGSVSFQEGTRRFQRDLLCRTLDETDWNITETARRLDLARSHVYNLIRAFGLMRET